MKKKQKQSKPVEVEPTVDEAVPEPEPKHEPVHSGKLSSLEVRVENVEAKLKALEDGLPPFLKK